MAVMFFQNFGSALQAVRCLDTEDAAIRPSPNLLQTFQLAPQPLKLEVVEAIRIILGDCCWLALTTCLLVLVQGPGK